MGPFIAYSWIDSTQTFQGDAFADSLAQAEQQITDTLEAQAAPGVYQVAIGSGREAIALTITVAVPVTFPVGLGEAV